MAHILGSSLYKSPLKVVLTPLYQMSSFAHAAEIIESMSMTVQPVLCFHVVAGFCIDIVNSKGCRCVPARWRYFSGKMSLKVRAGAAVWAVYASCCYCRPFSRILQFQSVKFQNIIQSNWSDPKKLDKNSTQKLFKQPKGLAVCELQAAGPLVLPWSCDCCSSPSSTLTKAEPWAYNKYRNGGHCSTINHLLDHH